VFSTALGIKWVGEGTPKPMSMWSLTPMQKTENPTIISKDMSEEKGMSDSGFKEKMSQKGGKDFHSEEGLYLNEGLEEASPRR
jgi:hypothetical protein